jgi:hypothetical protein
MSETERDAGTLGFLDSLVGLFRRREDEAGAQPSEGEARGHYEKLEAEFDSALQRLNEKIAEQRDAAAARAAGPEPVSGPSSGRAAERAQRLEAAHRAMREDIERAHADLGTGLAGPALDELARFVREMHELSATGRDAHSLVPRARHAVGERLRREAGELAAARLVALLQRAGRSWPDPTRYSPNATPQEIERWRRRRFDDIRAGFLASDLERTAQRMLGVVPGWGADYPERASPLWAECALEGVAAGIRAQLLREFVDVLDRDRDALWSRVEASVGAELQDLQRMLQDGALSIERANAVMASSLRVLDELVPEVAWEMVRSALPHARGEFGS